MKNAKEQTKQLEEESRKMEDRLRELKMAMSREKEQRERQGGFWRAGQTGTLHSYAQDVLESKPPKQQQQQRNKSGQSKIKVLKDEPINVPVRSKGPGTMGFIAAKKSSAKDSRIKGSECGQCEERGASVTCIQCSEDYCAGCFAVFHLKGALKKHRSVPLQANTPRQFTSPSPVSRIPNDSHLPASAVVTANKNASSNRNGPDGASGSFEGPSLLHGHYDESGSAASFQEALRAWRSGEGDTTSPRKSTHENNEVKTTLPQQSVRQAEHSTSTIDNQDVQEVEVKFNEHGISYAEKLLLKQHRKTDIVEFPSGRSLPSRGSIRGSFTPTPGTHRSFYDDEENLQTTGGHVDFQALYNVVKACDSESTPSRTGADSGLSIIELHDVPKLPGVRGGEAPGTCHVEEVENAPGESFNPSASNTRLGNITPKPSASRIAFTEERDAQGKGIPPFDKNATLQSHSSDRSIYKPPRSSRKPSHNIRGSKSSSVPYVTEPEDIELTSFNNHNISEDIFVEEKYTTEIKEDKVKNRPSTAKSRPASRNRPKSGGRPKSRANSRAQSSPGSRASIFGEGVLTKTPSSALHEVAQLSAPEPVSMGTSLSGFFLAGLETETGLDNKTGRAEDNLPKPFKISNRLYQMAPRSWRPESSLGETEPSMGKDKQQEEVTLSYTYSAQVEGSPIQVVTSPIRGDNLTPEPVPFSVKPPSTPKSHKLPSARSQRICSPNVLQRSVQSPVSSCDVESGRLSRAIVVEGEDMSRYDDDCTARLTEQEEEDGETLNQLEWELASETGRITADGKVSRLEVSHPDSEEEDLISDEALSGRLSRLTTPGPGYDIQTHLKESELMDDFEDMEALFVDEQAVKGLH